MIKVPRPVNKTVVVNHSKKIAMVLPVGTIRENAFLEEYQDKKRQASVRIANALAWCKFIRFTAQNFDPYSGGDMAKVYWRYIDIAKIMVLILLIWKNDRLEIYSPSSKTHIPFDIMRDYGEEPVPSPESLKVNWTKSGIFLGGYLGVPSRSQINILKSWNPF